LTFSAKSWGVPWSRSDARRIGSPIQRLLLVCFHFDLAHGPYSALIVEVLRVASLVMLLGTLSNGLRSVFGRARRARTAETLTMDSLPFFPERASTMASQVDDLYFAWLALSGVVALAVAGLIVWFAVRYRQGSAAARDLADAVEHEKTMHRIEVVWTVVPLVLFSGHVRLERRGLLPKHNGAQGRAAGLRRCQAMDVARRASGRRARDRRAARARSAARSSSS
jgi:hypothetical protein